MKNKYLILGFILTTILGLLLLGNKSLFLDEATSLGISYDWNTMISIFWKFEGNMWLYYLLLHFWLTLGTSVAILRSLSVLFAILTLIPVYFLSKDLFNKNTANLMMIILPLNLLFIKNAQFARGYSLLVFLTTLATLILFKLSNKYSVKLIVCYILVSALAIYSHLFAVLILISHFIFIIYLKNKKLLIRHLFALLFIFVFALPLLMAPSIKSSQINWISVPDASSLIATFSYLTFDFFPLALPCLLIFIRFILEKRFEILKNKSYIFILIWILFPIIFAFLFSIFIKSIYNLQYLIICLIPVLIFLTQILISLKKKLIFTILLSLIVLGSIIRLVFWYNEFPLPYTITNNKNTDWKLASVYISKNAVPNDKVIVIPAYTKIILDYYLADKKNINILDLQPATLSTGSTSEFDYKLINNLPSNDSRIWLIQDLDLSKNYPIKDIIKKEINKKYKLENSKDLYKINITLYEN